MQYRDAFNAFGYDLANHRQDWSSEKLNGICITLWRDEVDWSPSPPRFDLVRLHVPGENDWEHKSGNRKRRAHLQRAMDELDGWIDVIIVTGTPGDACEDADPWMPGRRRNHRWRLTKYDKATGFFAAAAAAAATELE